MCIIGAVEHMCACMCVSVCACLCVCMCMCELYVSVCDVSVCTCICMHVWSGVIYTYYVILEYESNNGSSNFQNNNDEHCNGILYVYSKKEKTEGGRESKNISGFHSEFWGEGNCLYDL